MCVRGLGCLVVWSGWAGLGCAGLGWGGWAGVGRMVAWHHGDRAIGFDCSMMF